MPLSPGTRLGPYELAAPLGAGGMGEVYKARDTRLNRDVALKTLPPEFAADENRRLRFEQEARAIAALNHPNIVSVHDIGSESGISYIITELVDGEPLGRTRPSLKKTLDIAIQIASGLAAAHDAGVVHRDLKPDNILLMRDGRIKILDFGLAKITTNRTPAGATRTITVHTEPGVVMGTVGYMSPEQVRGAETDQRSDIFSFGVILYELLAGQRAYQGETSVEVMTAILRHDPPELPSTVPSGVRQVVMHCLEKEPVNRYQSARDIAFSLEALSTLPTSVSSPGLSPLPAPKRSRLPLILATVALASVAAAYFAGARFGSVTTQQPSYSPLTFRRGAISTARFAPDGESIVYSAAWDGNPSGLFVTRRDFPESRPLGIANARLLSVSSSGELAIRLDAANGNGTLATVPLAGGSPHEILEGVHWADWSPDGKSMAVVLQTAGKTRLEYPIGKVLFESTHYIGNPRVSPNGEWIAFFDMPLNGDDRGFVSVVDRAGKITRLVNTESSSEQGLAWSASGDEVRFTAQYDAGGLVLHGVTLSGKMRTILAAPGSMELQDVGRDGRMLIARHHDRRTIIGSVNGKESDLTWFGSSANLSLSADGKLLAFAEQNPVVGPNYAVSVRKLDGSLPVRIGEGSGEKISPDGKWVLTTHPTHPGLFILPVGAGSPHQLQTGALQFSQLNWASDSTRVTYVGNEPAGKTRCFVQSIEPGSQPQAITQEGVSGCVLSRDGKHVGYVDGGKAWWQPLPEGERREIGGIKSSRSFIGWTPDGQSAYFANVLGNAINIVTLTLSTAAEKPLKAITISDPAGVSQIGNVAINDDASVYAYSYFRRLSELFLVTPK